jgi:predicted transcriptional regulator
MTTETRTPTVRISPHSHHLLQELANEEAISMQAVLDRALEHYRRERFLQEANADYEALKQNPKEWKKVLEERQIWEGTISDGIDEE